MNGRDRIVAGFIGWCVIVALRSSATQPYEMLWVLGNLASFLAAATIGVRWRNTHPPRPPVTNPSDFEESVHRG